MVSKSSLRETAAAIGCPAASGVSPLDGLVGIADWLCPKRTPCPACLVLPPPLISPVHPVAPFSQVFRLNTMDCPPTPVSCIQSLSRFDQLCLQAVSLSCPHVTRPLPPPLSPHRLLPGVLQCPPDAWPCSVLASLLCFSPRGTHSRLKNMSVPFLPVFISLRVKPTALSTTRKSLYGQSSAPVSPPLPPSHEVVSLPLSQPCPAPP